MNLTDALIDLLLVVFVVVCVLMGLAIMMQRSKQEGLGTSFGQGVASELLGTGASAFLVKATAFLAVLFFILAISLARLYAHKESIAASNESGVHQGLLAPAVAPASTNAAPSVAIPPAAPAVAPGTPAPVPPAATPSSAPAPATK